MRKETQLFLKLMFNESDTVCVSDSQFSYHSIPIKNVLNNKITLVSPNMNVPNKSTEDSNLVLVALNPIKGFRSDQTCYSFRNFLIELDTYEKQIQINYIKNTGLPYSAMIWSGSKSVHTLVSLSADLPNEKVYRFFSEWILNIISLADQNTKNPSRSIRLPGVIRPETNKEQELIEFIGKISVEELVTWLKKYPDSKPKEKGKIERSEIPDFSKVRPWVCEKLKNGIIPPDRNRQWFSIGVEFACAGYEESVTLDILRVYFSPDRDFKEREWETTIKSAFKWTYERK